MGPQELALGAGMWRLKSSPRAGVVAAREAPAWDTSRPHCRAPLLVLLPATAPSSARAPATRVGDPGGGLGSGPRPACRGLLGSEAADEEVSATPPFKEVKTENAHVRTPGLLGFTRSCTTRLVERYLRFPMHSCGELKERSISQLIPIAAS